MTDKEKAIVMAHTGICMLTGDKFEIFHMYVEDIMGRPVFTHEIGFLADTIKEKSKADFLALCADESKYTPAEREKIDRVIEEIKEASFKYRFELNDYEGKHTEQWEIVKLDRVLEILKRNIGGGCK